MITDVFLFPNGMVATFAARTKHDAPKQVPMLEGRYERVKFFLIPAINSCEPKIHACDSARGRLEKDMRRFCVLRRSKKKTRAEDLVEDWALQEAALVIK